MVGICHSWFQSHFVGGIERRLLIGNIPSKCAVTVMLNTAFIAMRVVNPSRALMMIMQILIYIQCQLFLYIIIPTVSAYGKYSQVRVWLR